ncbi:hypothetical protein MKK70_21275 [Methylobacterium sp. E-041]|uniref:hypothetical protein n=1 Tax=Methylobacterium sp. E-041 TaxID=2836573 RepID=UPI001FBA2AA5|nr:hypothetical protein [Methylobacterium sp. E-041]MCJ2107861.1 hypothetical protein [Methylobacterium sp. E-041]
MPDDMTRTEAARAHVQHCTSVAHIDPVNVQMDAPIIVGGDRYRLTYDPQSDLIVMMPEKAWQERLAKARAVIREHVVEMPGNAERVRIVQDGREWVVDYDGLTDEFVCRRATKVAR